ncbi:hypothetical protein [Xylella fastidiosa]|nr:hypothetical protein [Xylella fastidiosa]
MPFDDCLVCCLDALTAAGGGGGGGGQVNSIWADSVPRLLDTMQ